MNLFSSAAILGFAAALAGCSSSPSATSNVGTATRDVSGAYQVVLNGVVTTLPAANTGFSIGGITLEGWSGAGGITAYGTSTLDVTAVGGDISGTPFAGISGTSGQAVPTTGTANYTGQFGFAVGAVLTSGEINLTADFGAGTVVESSAVPLVAINGAISGAGITGTAVFQGDTENFVGGFYGATNGTIAGAISGTNFSGIFIAQ